MSCSAHSETGAKLAYRVYPNGATNLEGETDEWEEEPETADFAARVVLLS